MQDLAVEMRKSPRQVMRMVRALAETALRHQASVLGQVVKYVQLMKLAGALQAKLLVHKVKHDETQMIVRASYSSPTGHTRLHEHKARIFIVQEEWSLLVKAPMRTDMKCESESYSVLKGAFSPKVVVGQSATGESIKKILDRTLEVPRLAYDVCEQSWVLLESDECGANGRAAKMSHSPSLPTMHFYCMGHKVHQISKMVWDRFPQVHKGVTHVLKVLKAPGLFQKFQDIVLQLLDTDCFVVSSAPLSPEAQRYRENVLSLFFPDKDEKPDAHSAIVSIATLLLNGDWQKSGIIEHRCGGHCCPSVEVTKQKFRKYLPVFLKALHLQQLETSDWSGWAMQLCFAGALMHIHGLLQLGFGKAFHTAKPVSNTARVWQLLSEEPSLPDPEADAHNVAKMVDVATSWLRDPLASAHLYLLRRSLDVEVAMMAKLLRSTSASWTLRSMQAAPGELRGGTRKKREMRLKLGKLSVFGPKEMIQSPEQDSISHAFFPVHFIIYVSVLKTFLAMQVLPPQDCRCLQRVLGGKPRCSSPW